MRILTLSLIVFLLLFDLVHPNERKDSTGIVTKLNDGFMEKSIVKHWYNTDNVTSGVNDDGEGAKITDDLDNWSDTNMPSSSDNDNQVFIKPNKKRGRQHRHINYIKTSPQNPYQESIQEILRSHPKTWCQFTTPWSMSWKTRKN